MASIHLRHNFTIYILSHTTHLLDIMASINLRPNFTIYILSPATHLLDIMASIHFRQHFNSITIIHPCCPPAAAACLEGGGQNPASTAAAHVVDAVQAPAGSGSGAAQPAHSGSFEPAGGTLEVDQETGVESPWTAQMEGPEIVWLK